MEYVVFFLLLSMMVALGKGFAETRVGLRDLIARVRLASRRATPIGSARRGRVLLRGRVVRRGLPVKSPDGTALVLAYDSRQGWHEEGASTEFDLVDATGSAHVSAERPILLTAEHAGYQGEHTRLLRNGDEVVVYGDLFQVVDPHGWAPSFREPPRSLVLAAPRGGRVVIAPARRRLSANLARGLFGLVWGACCIAIGVAMWS